MKPFLVGALLSIAYIGAWLIFIPDMPKGYGIFLGALIVLFCFVMKRTSRPE